MHSVVAEKIQDFFDEGIPSVFERDMSLGDVLPPARGNLVKVVTGVRRCGKTFRLYQEMRRIVDQGYPADSILYFNFEDERLKPYSSALLSEVVDTFFAMNPKAKEQGAFFFFDEIQEVPDWGMFLRRMVDTQKATIYVSGSSSKLLSADLATEFRGRALSKELFPMSFSEYARFHGAPADTLAPVGPAGEQDKAFGSATIAKLRHLLGDYLLQGGFIAVQSLERADAIQLLQEYAQRAVNLDVVDRYGFKNPRVASQLLTRSLRMSGRELSLNKLHQALRSAGVSVARESLSNLLGYYEEAYLVFTLREFSRALADNTRSVSKVYAVDPGMLVAFSPSMARDEAQRLETAVFVKLRREAGSLREGGIARALIDDGGRHEIDFVVGDALMQDAFQLIQVSCDVSNERTRLREVSALRAGMRRFGIGEGTIVTLNDEETIGVSEGVVNVVPAWKWLL
ncbi:MULTISPECIES: ATP-binding protein [unclassified Adlercreutzia]|uniref:ATP-binding protein n=1 Tax=unclassified Adlercreutzia TaxID=2636013 RepID=UPI0013EB1AD2|nr:MULTISPECIES: ATP-binding protein [unclassified Adlercreutzia]